MSKVAGIYRIKLSDEHYYVGSTCRCSSRWASHLSALRLKRHGNPYMQRVFDVFGVFEPEVLIEISDPVARKIAEQEWLNANFDAPGCVNLNPSADQGPNQGRTLSLEHRKKLSMAHLGKQMSVESRAKMSVSQRARKATSETKARMSAAHKGHFHTDESKLKMSEIAKTRGGLGPRKHSEETLRRMSEAQKKKHIERRFKAG